MKLDRFPEAFARFESEINIRDSRDSNELIRKFSYWQNRPSSLKQQLLIRDIARARGIRAVKPRGISERKGIPRKELKRHYTEHKVRGKSRMVARISKGMKGAGRFATRG